MPLNLKQRVVDKSANYTVTRLNDRPETIFTNRGATGAVTFTLPPPSFAYLGDAYNFRSVVDQNIVVAGATAGDVVTKHNAAASSVAASTNNEKIGAAIRAECIKTGDSTYKWLVFGVAVGHTYTVA